MSDSDQRILDLCEPVIEELGYQCVHLAYRPGQSGARGALAIYIDRAGGVTVDDCARVSRELDVLLDVEDVVPASYALEVSSPGLDRPLSRLSDFEEHAGEDVVLTTRTPQQGRRRWAGVLCGLSGGDVCLRVDGETVLIPALQIKKANLRYAFGGKVDDER